MGEDIDKRDPAVRETIAGRFNRMIPHNQAIGLQVADVAGERIRTTLAYRADFLGDPEAGLWHTAIGTTAADSTCGLAVFLAIPGLESVATIDLRMDYLRPATIDRALLAIAGCLHITDEVAFVRCEIFSEGKAQPVATGSATFMRNTPGQRFKTFNEQEDGT